MRTTLLAAASIFMLASCSNTHKTLTLTNPLDFDRTAEIIEIPLGSLAVADGQYPYVTDAKGVEVPSQVTYDSLLIFAANIPANGTAIYKVATDSRQHTSDTLATGRVWPERADDMAWENDLVGFRAYGPALQRRGERGFGYDIFFKHGPTTPVIAQIYAPELDQANWDKVAEIRSTFGNDSASRFIDTFSYHIDHGVGMDCYAVGPTLGAGVTALMGENGIIYPWCWETSEILDNGPIRFTTKLTYTPLTVGTDSAVIETRLISLDAGQHLNRTLVSYDGLSTPTNLVTGISLHDRDGAVTLEADKGYMSYVDPTQADNNGKGLMGATFPGAVTMIEARPDEGPAHILASSLYTPGTPYEYFWGFAWDQTDIKTIEEWNEYLRKHALSKANPIKVTIE